MNIIIALIFVDQNVKIARNYRVSKINQVKSHLHLHVHNKFRDKFNLTRNIIFL